MVERLLAGDRNVDDLNRIFKWIRFKDGGHCRRQGHRRLLALTGMRVDEV
jgi:hypothetical protein